MQHFINLGLAYTSRFSDDLLVEMDAREPWGIDRFQTGQCANGATAPGRRRSRE